MVRLRISGRVIVGRHVNVGGKAQAEAAKGRRRGCMLQAPWICDLRPVGAGLVSHAASVQIPRPQCPLPYLCHGC